MNESSLIVLVWCLIIVVPALIYMVVLWSRGDQEQGSEPREQGASPAEGLRVGDPITWKQTSKGGIAASAVLFLIGVVFLVHAMRSRTFPYNAWFGAGMFVVPSVVILFRSLWPRLGLWRGFLVVFGTAVLYVGIFNGIDALFHGHAPVAGIQIALAESPAATGVGLALLCAGGGFTMLKGLVEAKPKGQRGKH